MLDRFNREINYLRISVTDRCNLRCEYCMPEDGIQLMSHGDILKLEEITEVVQIAATKFGITKIRLTGGEPLVRKGIIDLVKMINEIPEIEEVALTTNGILLPKMARELKQAGLTRVNISLDTMSPEKYKKITRIGDFDQVMQGIQAAKEAGLEPIKINVVKMDDSDPTDLEALRSFCKKEDLKIRFINVMNLKTGSFSQVDGGTGGNCSICNRLRLTANGDIKPCLFSNQAYNIRKHGIEQAITLALTNKPQEGKESSSHQFYNIGG